MPLNEETLRIMQAVARGELSPEDGRVAVARAEHVQANGLSFRVSPKRALSVYGLGRFPVTLYKSQWRRLLQNAGALTAFLDQHEGELRGENDFAEPTPYDPATRDRTRIQREEAVRARREAGGAP